MTMKTTTILLGRRKRMRREMTTMLVVLLIAIHPESYLATLNKIYPSRSFSQSSSSPSSSCY